MFLEHLEWKQQLRDELRVSLMLYKNSVQDCVSHEMVDKKHSYLLFQSWRQFMMTKIFSVQKNVEENDI